ncbi:MAG: UDP-N-acetylmuramoyl-L-alanyl-D-glutamate--2,6-diaminopimelate ligase [Oscillospiraceae bacterium]|nr:UDP-N-acetylmuramoyl-L-alanyl-D-glutamate--2,6-diaminopimelate ligase [Oscillospiraceae bacterium]
MKLSQLLEGIEILKTNAPMDMEIRGVSYDSRTTREKDVYVAIRGYATDGHKYIPQAVERGAAAIVCEEEPQGEVPYILVKDSRGALADMGANFYSHPTDRLTIIGVTGTNGKTTVTYLLKTILEHTLGAKVGVIGTIQNLIGDRALETERTTPESFELQGLFRRMADAGCTHVVMEASSHALYLQRLRGVRFKVGVFTNLTEDHLDFHGTMEEYRKAKEILFRQSSVAVLNADDPATEEILKSCPALRLTYGLNAPADLRAEEPELRADSVKMNVLRGANRIPLRLGIPGKFSVYNALAAVGAACALGIPAEKAVNALAGAKGVKGRVEVVPTPNKDYTVLIDYAHTPDGLENVLSSVKGYCKGRLIALFGCGGDRDPYKRPIMGKIGVDLADYVVFTSDNPRTEDPFDILRQVVAGAEGSKTPYTIIENRRAAIRYAMDMAKKDDIIVLCGKGHETYQIIGTEKTHLDEREEVAAYLAGK